MTAVGQTQPGSQQGASQCKGSGMVRVDQPAKQLIAASSMPASEAAVAAPCLGECSAYYLGS
jgi:hypothetical protein